MFMLTNLLVICSCIRVALLEHALKALPHVITVTSVDRARESEILGHIAQAVREALSGS